MVYRMKGENVLVTGGAGFIGSALVRELLNKHANVIVYDSFLYGDPSNLKEVEERIEVIHGDVLSWKIYDAIKRYKPKYVFHLAAEPYIPHCYDNPEKFFDVNLKGTLNVLMACKTFDVERIVYFSSSEVYGTARYIPMDEEHPTLPLSSYAVSKLAADRMCFVFSREHHLPIVIVRPFNCYGPRETQPYVIPEIISQLSRGNVVKLGNVKAKRDFTYVHDTANGAISIMESDITNGEVINVGSNKAYSIKELAHLIGRLSGYETIEIQIEKARLRPLDVDVLQCDYSKVNRLTRWEPEVGIEEGLKRTIDWFLRNRSCWLWERFL